MEPMCEEGTSSNITTAFPVYGAVFQHCPVQGMTRFCLKDGSEPAVHG